MTPEEEIADALETVKETQVIFWNALSQLESLTGLELNGSRDYAQMTVNDLEQEQDDDDDYTIDPDNV